MDSSKCTIICERDEKDKKFQCNEVSCPEIPGNAINTIVEDNNTQSSGGWNNKAFKSTEVGEEKSKRSFSVFWIFLVIFLICIFAKLMKIF